MTAPSTDVGPISAAYKIMIEKLNADTYLKAAKNLKKSSGWKYQTQKFLLNELTEIFRLEDEVNSGKYAPSQGKSFRICENGHTRMIQPALPRDSVMQNALTNEILIPGLKPYLIHDNGASLTGKGISFTRRRFEQHLHWHYRRYGTVGYILLVDFRKYFDNIPHAKVKEIIAKRIPDAAVSKVMGSIIKNYEVDVSYSDDPNIEKRVFSSLDYQSIPDSAKTGRRMMRKSVGIGSPTSQIIGVSFPTPIHQYCKTVKGVHCLDVFMDDMAVIHPDKVFLKDLLTDIRHLAKEQGIFINEKKTQIIKLSHGFTWLKVRYSLTDTGKIIKKIPRDVITRQRRKMKRLAAKAERGERTWEYFKNWYQSWRGDKVPKPSGKLRPEPYHAFHTVRNLDRLYKELTENGRKRKKEQRSGNHHAAERPARE